MAELYEAEALGAGGVTKRVAIKRVLPRYANDAAFIAMFAEEARVASTLHHANIIQTLNVIENEGQLLLVMELLDGLDLLQFCRRLHRQGVSPEIGLLLHIIDRVLAALHYAHERTTPEGRPLGVVHRDVSPQNVFVTIHGVKLLDFGVSKAESLLDRGNSSGVIKGKVLYLSPEQCLGDPIKEPIAAVTSTRSAW